MTTRCWIIALALSTPALALAKPPDLPLDISVLFQESFPESSGLLPAPVIGTLSEHVVITKPAAVPPCAIERSSDRPRNTVVDRGLSNDPRVKALFHKVERYRSDDRKNQARASETPMTTSTIRVTVPRLGSVANRSNDFSEEQEPPLERAPSTRPQPRHDARPLPRAKPTMEEYLRTLNMLQSTQPLGTAPTGPEPF